jgi:F-type H+-transporting ATPase subunit b
MKNLLRSVFLTLAIAATSFAAEGEGGGEGNIAVWKWANFLVLAGALIYIILKNAGPFFEARTRQIRKDMIESEQIRADAEARAAEVDRRLANLANEIASLRGDAQRQSEVAMKRATEQTAADMAKIQAHAEQEIAAAGKAARNDLRRYSAELAVQLAEQKIRARMTPDAQDALVKRFARQLDPPVSSGAHT